MSGRQPTRKRPTPKLPAGLPTCPECGTTMALAHTEPGQSGLVLQTLRCPNCECFLDRVLPDISGAIHGFSSDSQSSQKKWPSICAEFWLKVKTK